MSKVIYELFKNQLKYHILSVHENNKYKSMINSSEEAMIVIQDSSVTFSNKIA
jgi:hypothetical protein